MRFWLATFAAVVALVLPTRVLLFLVCGSPSAYIADQYKVVPNIPYVTRNTWHGTLDLYLPKVVAGPHPTVIYIHGGGWMDDRKEM